ncbi:MAG: hypothetical protein KatS3mg125_0773 [Lysobacterales bacterium]|nr:MAG: hypothetical protein KatS3mg125_0773 [Xanthomonadales bacterium]
MSAWRSAASASLRRCSQHGVHYLVGDFTREDPAIARYLARFGRNGVPLYVLYPGWRR